MKTMFKSIAMVLMLSAAFTLKANTFSQQECCDDKAATASDNYQRTLDSIQRETESVQVPALNRVFELAKKNLSEKSSVKHAIRLN